MTIPGGAAVTKVGQDSLVFRVVMFSQQAPVSKDSRASMALPIASYRWVKMRPPVFPKPSLGFAHTATILTNEL